TGSWMCTRWRAGVGTALRLDSPRERTREVFTGACAGSVDGELARGTSTVGRKREAHDGAAVADRADLEVDAGEGEEQIDPRQVGHAGERLGGIAIVVLVLVRGSRRGLLAQQILGASEAAVDVGRG